MILPKMEWENTSPGVWNSPTGFKIMQLGRGRLICTCRDWSYETRTLEDAQRTCRVMTMSAWYREAA